ncbi:MAG: hypothetical protein GY803_32580, partial [Chloroflexi bacterium]|nr:hypothetical protein [Chloroflexota bacterium]
DSETGNRYLYLDVTAFSGSSENGFEIWAGPPDYVDTVPSNVNFRNVHILNNPGSHDSDGIVVYSSGTKPTNSNIDFEVDIPLVDVPPTYAGESILISLFDSDSGAQPPIGFFFDSVAETDWFLEFDGTPADHPDAGYWAGLGESVDGRCFFGSSCQNAWIDPPLRIQVPTLDPVACAADPGNQDVCTPFAGGRLMARYIGGHADTYAWRVEMPDEPSGNPTSGCSAFPIALHDGIRSLDDVGGANPYPDADDFDYPNPPPSYNDFLANVPQVSLRDAGEGYIFRVYNGFDSGNFGWLLWNMGRPSSASVLADSLTWPGDSTDYTDHDDSSIYPATLHYPHIVRGYVEPMDALDIAMHIGDWVAALTGSVNAATVRDALASHIDLAAEGRTLRLLIWDESAEQGNNGHYRISGFGLFQLHGYSMSQGGGGSWLLLEFIGWDTSCGQPSVAPENVAINGPANGSVNASYTFMATVSPVETGLPLTY